MEVRDLPPMLLLPHLQEWASPSQDRNHPTASRGESRSLWSCAKLIALEDLWHRHAPHPTPPNPGAGIEPDI